MARSGFNVSVSWALPEVAAGDASFGGAGTGAGIGAGSIVGSRSGLGARSAAGAGDAICTCSCICRGIASDVMFTWVICGGCSDDSGAEAVAGAGAGADAGAGAGAGVSGMFIFAATAGVPKEMIMVASVV